MKIITALFLALFSNWAFAKETYTVNNFSDDFYGKIYIEQPSEVFSKGWIVILDKKTNKELIKVESDELALSLHDGKAIANIKELPYGEQSLIMYEDYNFDGKKDLAIEDGQNSCYHGPSFNIYLADKNKFTFNKDFTRLAHEYCGMFDVNAAEKKLSTMTKDGCCWHQFSTFIIKNNKPKAISIIEEDASSTPPFHISSEETWNGRKMVKTSEKTLVLAENNANIVLSFQVKNNDKQVVLFELPNAYSTTLIYALLKKNEVVEFSYPEDLKDRDSKFKFHTTPNKRSLTFDHKKATYILYEDTENNKFGIKINVDGKTYDWKGIEKTKKGSLNFLNREEFDNVVEQ